MKMKKALATMCVAAALASCGTSRNAVSVESLDGEWNIVRIDGQDVKAPDGQDAPFIGFDTKENRVYGSTSCNRLTGALNADAKKGTIDFGALGSTRMMCRDMDTEQKVLGALGRVKTFKVQNGGSLLLNTEDGKTVMELKQK